MFNDPCPGGGSPIRIKNAVHTEIAVMLPLPMVAAVGVAAVRVQHRMVHHLPDTAAHQVIIPVDLLPVALRIAGSYAHGMGVFAEEIGPIAELGYISCTLSHLMHLFHGRIHLAAHIVGSAPGMDHALIVDGQIGSLFQIAVHSVRIAPAAGFVAQAPHNDGRMELIPVEKPAGTIQVMQLPGRIVADMVVIRGQTLGPAAMGLQIGFIHHIDAQLIAQLQQIGIRGIVGSAYGIYIIFPAQADIPLHIRRGHGIAAGGAGIVVVNAMKLYRPAVDPEHPSVHSHPLKAHPFPDTAGLCLNQEVIEHRLLRIPLPDEKLREGHLGHMLPGIPGQSLIDTMALQRKTHRAVPIERGSDRSVINRTEVPRSRIGQTLIGHPAVGLPGNIPDIALLTDPQQHIPENSVIAEHILTFQIGAVAPSVHHGQQFVFSRIQKIRHVKFRRIVGTLGITHKAAIYIQIHTAGHAQERDHMSVPGILHPKEMPVHAHKIIFLAGIPAPGGNTLIGADPGKDGPHRIQSRDSGRLKGELVAAVHVKGFIIPLELPAARHRDPVPAYFLGIQYPGHLRRSGIEMKVPLTV